MVVPAIDQSSVLVSAGEKVDHVKSSATKNSKSAVIAGDGDLVPKSKNEKPGDTEVKSVPSNNLMGDPDEGRVPGRQKNGKPTDPEVLKVPSKPAVPEEKNEGPSKKGKTDDPLRTQQEPHISSSTADAKKGEKPDGPLKKPPSSTTAANKDTSQPAASTSTAVPEVKAPTPGKTGLAPVGVPNDLVEAKKHKGTNGSTAQL